MQTATPSRTGITQQIKLGKTTTLHEHHALLQISLPSLHDYKLGTLRSNDATATRTSLKKRICVLSVFIAIIHTHLLCQLQANPPEAEFQGTIAKLKKRNKISSLLVYVLHKTRNQAFSRRSRAKTGKKCTKKCDARAELWFC